MSAYMPICRRTLFVRANGLSRDKQLELQGSSGLSTGEHLHFEVTNAGKPVNPLPFLATLTKYYNQFEYAGKEKLSFIYDE